MNARFLDVVCAIIPDSEGKILCARRGPNMAQSGKWEFPGGKLEESEGLEQGIIREIREELGLELMVVGRGPCFVSLFPSGRILRLYVLKCEVPGGKPMPAEHDSITWLFPDEMAVLDWQEADLPIVEWLIQSTKVGG